MKQIRYLSLVGFMLFVFSFFTGCKKQQEEPAPKSVLTANAGPDQAVSVGDEVTLDGSKSEDSEGNSFTYSWSFKSKPDSSDATLSGETTPNPTFTPDAPGEYVVDLTVSNNDSEDTDDVKITAAKNVEPLEIGGSITENTTLEDRFDDPLLPDYIASSNVNVGASLTIKPGVFIIFKEDVMMNVQQGGTLIAEGTSSDSIKFSSANVEGGILWKGIMVLSASSQNSLKYAIVTYAGNSAMDFVGENFPAGVGVDQDGNMKIENSRISDNAGYGIYIDDNGGHLNTFANNLIMNNMTGVGVPADEVEDMDANTQFSGNSSSAVEIFASTLDATAETSWNALHGDAAYHVSGDLDISGVLTINAGAKFEMDEDVLITVDGALIASGASGNMVQFTAFDKASPLLWKGVYFSSTDGRNSLDYVSVSYAGNSEMDFVGANYKAAVGVEQDGKLSVTNSTISGNTGYGLYVDDNGGILVDFSSNTFENNDRAVGVPADEVDNIDGATVFNNNSQADVEIFSSTYSDTKASTWHKLHGTASYRVSGELTIAGDLTIEAGAKFEFDEDVLMKVTGTIAANGTASGNITFTTSNLAGSLHWKGIMVTSGSSLNSLNFVNVSYAGNSEMDFVGANYSAGVGVDESGKISVTNSTFSDNTGYGLYVDNGGGQIVDFSDNTFENNDQGVGIPADEADDMDGNTVFTNNVNADVEIFSTTYSAAKTSTWQSLSGGAAYRITGDVDIEGVLTIAPGAKFEMDQDVEIDTYGALIAEGTSGNMITFTTSNQAGGILWKGLFVLSADTRNVLDFVHVSYGGNTALDFVGSNFKANVGVDDGAFLNVTNSVISNGGGYGIYSIGSTNDFTAVVANNTFTNNISGNFYTP